MHGAGAHQLQGAADGAGQAGGNAGENDDGDAVAEAALGDLFAQPHQEHGTGHQRAHGDETEHEPGIEDQPRLRFQRDGDAYRLKQRQKHGAIARVLRDLALPRLAFFLQLLQLGRNRRHQLHDDRGGNVGHDPQGENGEARQGPAGEHVEHAEDSALLRLEQIGEHVRIDSGHRDMRTDAEHDQRAEQEQQTLFQVAELAGLADILSVGSHLAARQLSLFALRLGF